MQSDMPDEGSASSDDDAEESETNDPDWAQSDDSTETDEDDEIEIQKETGRNDIKYAVGMDPSSGPSCVKLTSDVSANVSRSVQSKSIF